MSISRQYQQAQAKKNLAKPQKKSDDGGVKVVREELAEIVDQEANDDLFKLRLPKSLKRKLIKVCEANDDKPSEVVRDLIREYVRK